MQVIKACITPPGPVGFAFGFPLLAGGLLGCVGIVDQRAHQVFFELGLRDDVIRIPLLPCICKVGVCHTSSQHCVEEADPPFTRAKGLLYAAKAHRISIPAINLVKLGTINRVHIGLPQGPLFKHIHPLHQLALCSDP